MMSKRLRVLLYADLRTSHALGWYEGLRASGLQVLPISSELVPKSLDVREIRDPVGILRRNMVQRGLNQRIRSKVSGDLRHSTQPIHQGRAQSGVDRLQMLETILAALRYPVHRRILRRAVNDFRPDIVHALRLPYEGLIALSSLPDQRVVVSSWGQDFMMQAAGDGLLRKWIEKGLPLAAGLCVDTPGDAVMARALGLSPRARVLHVAGNFGVDPRLFHPGDKGPDHTIVYPRGVRRYVRHDVFLSLARRFAGRQDLHFVGIGLDRDPASLEAASVADVKLHLTPELRRETFAALLRTASVVVSPSTSDGTPNSLLEARACGASVIAGDIPSARALRELDRGVHVLDVDDDDAWMHLLDQLTRHPREDGAADVSLEPPYSLSANVQRVPQFYSRVVGQA
jgi:glycosyltransferase involved in cell wall biosynthesis